MNKAIIYARLSREDEVALGFEGKSKSIENQINLLANYAKNNNLTIYKTLVDDGISGANMQRPAFLELKNEILLKTFNVLLVKDFSRLGRVMHEVGDFVENLLPIYAIRLICVDDGFDSFNLNVSEESSVLKYYINEYNLKEFKKKSGISKIHNAKVKHLNYYPKFGYRFDSDRQEVVDDFSSKIVIKAFELIANSSFTTAQVASLFNKQNIPTRSHYAKNVLGLKSLNKNASNVWTAEKVWEIVKDCEYCGHSVNLKYSKTDKPIIIKNNHCAIVSEELFLKAQEVIFSRAKNKNKLNHLGKLLIDNNSKRNLLFQKNNKNPKLSSYYLRVNGKRVYSFSATGIEEVIFNDVVKIVKKFLAQKRNEENVIAKINLLNKEMEKINLLYEKVLNDHLFNKISSTQFNSSVKTLNEKLKNIESEIELVKLNSKKFKGFENSLNFRKANKIEVIKLMVKSVKVTPLQNQNYKLNIVYKA